MNTRVQLEAVLTNKSEIVYKGSCASTVRQASGLALGFAGNQSRWVSWNELSKPVEIVQERVTCAI